MGEIPGSQNEKWQEPIPTGKHTSGFWGFWAGSFWGRPLVPKMKNGRNPIPLTNTRRVLGLLGGIYWGRSPVPEMKNGRGPFTQKGEKKKKRKRKKGRELEKTLASSKILTHGLGSLKGSPQCERKKKKEHCAATIPLSGIDLQHHINRSQSQSDTNPFSTRQSRIFGPCVLVRMDIAWPMLTTMS